MSGDWNPDDEIDPVELQKEQLKLQKEQLALGRKIVEKAEAAEAKAKAAEDSAKRPPVLGRVAEGDYAQAGPSFRSYTPPTFEEVSVRICKAWSEVARILPDAPDGAKILAFQVLLQKLGSF